MVTVEPWTWGEADLQEPGLAHGCWSAVAADLPLLSVLGLPGAFSVFPNCTDHPI